MHIQMKTKKILSRISALFLALIICATLAVSAFALNGVSPTNGYFSIKNLVTGAVATYALPSSPPVDGSGNYVSFIACNPNVGDQYPPVVFYITYNNSDWDMEMVNSVFYTSPSSYYDCYRFTFASSNSVSSVYVATWYSPDPEDALKEPSWVQYSSSSSGTQLDVYAFVASSKDITNQGIVLFKKNTYANGVNGTLSGGATVDGSLSYSDGVGNYYPIVPNTPAPVYPVYDGDLHSLFYGFVQGMWSGLWQGYEIFGNGIAVGGYTLHQLIISCLGTLVVVLVIIFIVNLIRGK